MVSLLSSFFPSSFFITLLFLIIYIFTNFILSYFICLPFYFFPPFLLSRVADRVLVLQPGVRPEPLTWESRVQDIGPPETSWTHVISNGENSPRDLCLNTKTQLHSTISKLQCWTAHDKQLARQEHNPTH